ncbi:hypothetical protein CH300_05280 [Rhodococcus sp. 15-1154-1]|nr:hypothetical protein CH300_05280 [Rhodococcus sp. 15-1154-1]
MTTSCARSRVAARAFAASSGVALAACSGETVTDIDPEASRMTQVTGASTAEAANGQVVSGEVMRIDIRIDDRTVIGTLGDSAASRDLLAQLPVTLNMSDHGSVEKTGPLPSELSTDGASGSADPNPGDIGYYAPGNDFVLYYGDQEEFPGIVILGSMDETGLETVCSIDGDVTVTVTRSE